MATPSPVATAGLVVFRNTLPSPPVASSTPRAQIAMPLAVLASWNDAPHTPSASSRSVAAA